MPELNEDLIERYLLGQLEGEELAEFEVRLALEPELEKEVRKQKRLIGAIQRGRKDELKSYLRKELKNRKISERRKAVPLWRNTGVRIGASLAVAASIAVLLYNNNSYVRNSLRRPKDIINSISISEKQDSNKAYAGDTGRSEVALADSTFSHPDSQALVMERSPGKDTPTPDILSRSFGMYDSVTPIAEGSLAEAPNEAKEEELEGSGIMDSVQHDKLLKDTSIALIEKSSLAVVSQGSYRINSDKDIQSYNKKQESIPARKEEAYSLQKERKVAARPTPEGNASRDGFTPAGKQAATLKLEYWESPIRFRGYRFFRNVLQLYGIKPEEKPVLIKLDDSYYLKTTRGTFGILEQNDYNPFITVKSQEILEKLR